MQHAGWPQSSNDWSLKAQYASIFLIGAAGLSQNMLIQKLPTAVPCDSLWGNAKVAALSSSKSEGTAALASEALSLMTCAQSSSCKGQGQITWNSFQASLDAAHGRQ